METQTFTATTLAVAPNMGTDGQKVIKRSLGIIFFVLLMDVIGLSILFPVAPYIVQRYSNDALMVTMLSVIYAGGQFFAAPLLGKLSDRYGRRPVLLFSILGSAVGYFIFGVGGALWILLLARLLDGFSGGNMSTASAYIADVSKPEERAKNFALIGMAFGVGFILGPALGGVLSQLSLDAPAFAAGVLALVSVAVIYFLLPESLPPARRQTTPLRSGDLNPFASIGAMTRKPGVDVLLLVSCLFSFAFDGINSTAGIFVMQKFAAQPWQIALLLVVTGLTIAVMQGALVERTVRKFGEKPMAIASLVGQAVGNALIFVAPALWLLYPIGMLTSAIGGFIWSTMGGLIASQVEAHEQGTLAGVNTALASAMTVLGPLWAGVVYDSVMPGSPYWMGALIFLLAAWIMITRVQRATYHLDTKATN